MLVYLLWGEALQRQHTDRRRLCWIKKARSGARHLVKISHDICLTMQKTKYTNSVWSCRVQRLTLEENSAVPIGQVAVSVMAGLLLEAALEAGVEGATLDRVGTLEAEGIRERAQS